MREPLHLDSLYLGIDFGTSGARAIAIDAAGDCQASISYPFAADALTDWRKWQTALFGLISELPVGVRQRLSAIAINGTSSTVLLCKADGTPLSEPLMYHDARAVSALPQIEAIAPPHHTVLSSTSSLAKLLWWQQQGIGLDTDASANAAPVYFLHQADWLSALLHGQFGVSDYHNALKLGYDVGTLRYPDWMEPLQIAYRLPDVVKPGTVVGTVTEAIAQQFALPPDCAVCAGTTDSIAAFLASGAQQPGEAVTSLGSTLVLKLLSDVRVDDARYGIYSHRLGDLWLVGGASNTGGAVLRHYFTDEELRSLSAQIQPQQDSPLDYYPLLKPGERFPINDPGLLPRVEPRPSDSAAFLHGLLQGISRIEALGYERLQALGATPLQKVYTAGGGAKNPTWMEMRSRLLGCPVLLSPHQDAAYGSALIAMRSDRKSHLHR